MSLVARTQSPNFFSFLYSTRKDWMGNPPFPRGIQVTYTDVSDAMEMVGRSGASGAAMAQSDIRISNIPLTLSVAQRYVGEELPALLPPTRFFRPECCLLSVSLLGLAPPNTPSFKFVPCKHLLLLLTSCSFSTPSSSRMRQGLRCVHPHGRESSERSGCMAQGRAKGLADVEAVSRGGLTDECKRENQEKLRRMS